MEDTDLSGAGNFIVFRNLNDGISYGNEQHKIRIRNLIHFNSDIKETSYRSSIYEKVWKIDVGKEHYISILRSVEIR